jgi:hypothetical protein
MTEYGFSHPHSAEPMQRFDRVPHYTLDDLTNTGLLWAINRHLLHPGGYSMIVERDSLGHAISWGIVKEDEPIRYEQEVDNDRSEKWQDTLLFADLGSNGSNVRIAADHIHPAKDEATNAAIQKVIDKAARKVGKILAEAGADQ